MKPTGLHGTGLVLKKQGGVDQRQHNVFEADGLIDPVGGLEVQRDGTGDDEGNVGRAFKRLAFAA